MSAFKGACASAGLLVPLACCPSFLVEQQCAEYFGWTHSDLSHTKFAI